MASRLSMTPKQREKRDARIVSMRVAGHTLREIAKKVGTSINLVRYILVREVEAERLTAEDAGFRQAA